VNEAVERASREGILTCASLMVTGPAAADAVARARRLPGLKVGLHLVLVEGRPALPPEAVPDLVDRSGAFEPGMARAGIRFFFRPRVRRQLAAEIRAQFEAFRSTGLALDHVNAHKHFHIHPTVSRLVLRIGREFGLRALRVPAEPTVTLRRAASAGERVARPLYEPWIALLARRLRRAGVALNDHLFGLAWTGAMTEDRLLRLLPVLPGGVSELYLHPAARRSDVLTRTMPSYRPTEELAALLSPRVRAAIAERGIELTTYTALAAERP
jgi:hopanoid biosynthesis associated protein HpnK